MEIGNLWNKIKICKELANGINHTSSQCEIWTVCGIENVMSSLWNGIFFPGSRYCLSEYFLT